MEIIGAVSEILPKCGDGRTDGKIDINIHSAYGGFIKIKTEQNKTEIK